MKARIQEIIRQHEDALGTFKQNIDRLEKVASLCRKALKKGNKIFFFGNGGSAADSQHFAAELVGRFQRERKPLAAIALSVNTSTLTAVGNDFGFAEIFSRQIASLAKPGDIAIGLSTSGNSLNVIKGFLEAKKHNLHTIAFLGKTGGKVAPLVDIALIVPANKTPRIQEMHILAGHIICELIENP